MHILDPEAGDLASGAARVAVKRTWDSVVAGMTCGHRHRGTAAAEKCARERLNQGRTLRLNTRDDCSQYVAPSERVTVLCLGTEARRPKAK
jgi:hypothetical protein